MYFCILWFLIHLNPFHILFFRLDEYVAKLFQSEHNLRSACCSLLLRYTTLDEEEAVR
jgi:hypothetical protein